MSKVTDTNAYDLVSAGLTDGGCAESAIVSGGLNMEPEPVSILIVCSSRCCLNELLACYFMWLYSFYKYMNSVKQSMPQRQK